MLVFWSMGKLDILLSIFTDLYDKQVGPPFTPFYFPLKKLWATVFQFSVRCRTLSISGVSPHFRRSSLLHYSITYLLTLEFLQDFKFGIYIKVQLRFKESDFAKRLLRMQMIEKEICFSKSFLTSRSA